MSYITCVIPSYVDVDKQYLKVCVESLRDSGFGGDITVVANGTKDLKPLHDCPIRGISKFLVTKQQGQCNAVNQGAKMVEGDCKWLFVSNSDMYYAPGWDKNLMKYLKATPVKHKSGNQQMCFSPNLVEPVNNNGSAEPFLKCDGGYTLDEFDKDLVDGFVKAKISEHEKPTTGFNLPFFINIEAWRTFGGYDTKYDAWGSNSDTDLQTLIELIGIQPMRMRDVLVYHFSNKSGTFDGSHQEEWQRNFDYYTQKFGYNRDTYPCDTWMAKNMVDYENLKFKPEWMGKYA